VHVWLDVVFYVFQSALMKLCECRVVAMDIRGHGESLPTLHLGVRDLVTGCYRVYCDRSRG